MGRKLSQREKECIAEQVVSILVNSITRNRSAFAAGMLKSEFYGQNEALIEALRDLLVNKVQGDGVWLLLSLLSRIERNMEETESMNRCMASFRL